MKTIQNICFIMAATVVMILVFGIIPSTIENGDGMATSIAGATTVALINFMCAFTIEEVKDALSFGLYSYFKNKEKYTIEDAQEAEEAFNNFD